MYTTQLVDLFCCVTIIKIIEVQYSMRHCDVSANYKLDAQQKRRQPNVYVSFCLYHM